MPHEKRAKDEDAGQDPSTEEALTHAWSQDGEDGAEHVRGKRASKEAS